MPARNSGPASHGTALAVVLRRARLEHRKRQHHPTGEPDPWGRPLDETVVLVLKTWTCDGTGHTFAPAAELALASAARARAH
jgi:hypothetical protein